MRKQLDDIQVGLGIGKVVNKLYTRLEEKGYGTFASTHEILGVITEEYTELIEAIHRNDSSKVKSEVLDIAVAAILGFVCLEENTVDW